MQTLNASHCASSALNLLLLCACSAVPVAPLQTDSSKPASPTSLAPSGQLTLVLGSRTIDGANGLDVGESELVDIGDHTAFGIEYSTIGQSGFGTEVGLFYSSGDDDIMASGENINLELSLLEVTFGGRYTLLSAPVVSVSDDYASAHQIP